jgi:hypothetical protein
MDTDGGEPGDGAWYWREQNEIFEDIDDTEPHGPFESAVDAGRAARAWIVFSSEGRSND